MGILGGIIRGSIMLPFIALMLALVALNIWLGSDAPSPENYYEG